jgi:uncharacterized protein (DUF1697 family)
MRARPVRSSAPLEKSTGKERISGKAAHVYFHPSMISPMPRYAAFLRGVSPMNARMPEVKKAFEAAGFTNVKTLLSSGNVVFDSRTSSTSALARKAQAAMRETLGREFLTIVRPIDALREMLASDPFKGIRIERAAKRIVTFVNKPPKSELNLPIERDGARILRFQGGAVFSVYSPTPKGPVFMTLIERAFGKEQTTRTWQTLEKVVSA